MYFVWFSLLWILIAFNMAFKDILSTDVQVAIFLTLILASCFLNIRYKILDSWFKQLANIVLELVLVGLAFSINISEWMSLTEAQSNKLGKITVMTFTVA